MASPVPTKNCKVCDVDLSTVRRYGGRCMKCYSDHVCAKRKALRKKAVEYAGNKCAHCGGTFPVPVYDFHHIDEDRENDRSRCISIMCRNSRPWEVIKEEIDKCILLCANCHRIHHFDDN